MLMALVLVLVLVRAQLLLSCVGCKSSYPISNAHLPHILCAHSMK